MKLHNQVAAIAIISTTLGLIMTGFAAYLSNRVVTLESRYDELYKHKENILNRLLS